MNNKGISFVETCLSIVIFFLIVGSIIPLSYQLKATVHSYKLNYYASEVALDGVKIANKLGQTYGVKKIENIQYEWFFYGDEVCVTYQITDITKRKCIKKSDDISN